MRDTSLDEFIGEDDADSDGDDGSEDDAAATVGPVEGDGEGGADNDAVAEEGTDDVVTQEPAGGDERDEGGAAADGVQPAVSTCDWTPDGASCAECDAVVERRWRDGGDLVCADCKDW